MFKIDEFLNEYEGKTFHGYSVFDAFNSPLTISLMKLNIKFVNVTITQFFKRFPYNIRPFFLIKKSINPKSLGLALKASLLFPEKKLFSEKLLNLILDTKSEQTTNFSWGYNWHYYTLRGGTFPKHFPNSITTYFIADALLDMYKNHPSNLLFNIINSIEQFFIKDINIITDKTGICFSYSSMDHKQIYNASALITRFLIRKKEIIGYVVNEELIDKSLSYLSSKQNENGSWYYGRDDNQKWVDSFHTEYMLELFMHLPDKNDIYSEVYKKAKKYYLDNFIKEEHKCNYFPDKIYPINIHSVASRIIFLCHINETDEASKIVKWVFNNMYNKKTKGFFYEKNRLLLNKNVYHRWNQSWMYLALSMYKKTVCNN